MFGYIPLDSNTCLEIVEVTTDSVKSRYTSGGHKGYCGIARIRYDAKDKAYFIKDGTSYYLDSIKSN